MKKKTLKNYTKAKNTKTKKNIKNNNYTSNRTESSRSKDGGGIFESVKNAASRVGHGLGQLAAVSGKYGILAAAAAVAGPTAVLDFQDMDIRQKNERINPSYYDEIISSQMQNNYDVGFVTPKMGGAPAEEKRVITTGGCAPTVQKHKRGGERKKVTSKKTT
tara:strand:- start:866 stop:1351 length:486 start_codon:yes stop_codon:yes gene_type:complete